MHRHTLAALALALAASTLLLENVAHAQDAGPVRDVAQSADGGADDASMDAPTVAPTMMAAPAAPITEVAGWKITATSSDRRLPDGRATAEACGWEQDVVVEGVAPPHTIKKGVLRVPCIAGETGLAAGEPAISFAGEAGMDAVTASQWRPVDDAQLTKRAALKGGADPGYPEALGAKKTEGVTVLLVDVSEAGQTRGVEVTRPSGNKAFDDAALAAAEKLSWFPAMRGEEPVDSSVRYTVRYEMKGDEPTVSTTVGTSEAPMVAAADGTTTEGGAPIAADQACPPLPDGKPDPTCTKAEAKVAEHPFLKGELTQMGTVQLVNSRTSFGVGIGAAAIDNVYYAVLRPDLNLHFGRFGLGLGAPLRFEIMDGNKLNAADPRTYDDAFEDLGDFRVQDWDEIEDALRPLKYLTWGRKEDNLFIDLNRVHALTIGHGQLMRRYQPNLDIDADHLYAEADGYLDFGGVEIIVGPLPKPRIAGALVFVKPLGLFMNDYVSKSLSIGATYITDLNAPTQLVTDPNPADLRQQLAVDQAGQFLWAERDDIVGQRVQGVGTDIEVKAFKWQFIDVKVYGDYSHLFFPGVPEATIQPFSDGGFALGSLLRMSFGSRPVRSMDDESEEVRTGKAPRELKADHAMRFRLEGRTFGPQYLPSYFNTLYEVDRLQFGVAPRDQRATLPTKIRFLSDQAGEPWRVGYYAEGSYTWVDYIGVTAAYEDAYSVGGSRPVQGRNLALHAETFGLGWLQLFATYHFRNFENFDGIFSFGSDQELLFVGGRLQLLPILFLNLNVQRAFKVGFSDDDLPGQTRPLTNALADDKEYRFSSIGLENAWLANFDIELGWQF